MNHKQVLIDGNLDLIATATKGIEYSKKIILSERYKVETFKKYISSMIAQNKNLRKHEMYNDGSRTYCLECGFVEEEIKT